jgi:ferritin heavy chain
MSPLAFASGFAGLSLRRVTAGTTLLLRRCSGPSAPVVVAPVVVAPRMQAGGGKIDFSKVDMAAAGDSLSGLVFTPEGADAVVDTRCGGIGYTKELEAALNRHINVEYTAMYAYHALWAYFDRDTVALPGFAKHFNDASLEEREHASEFMQYQNKRGGKIELLPVAVPEMCFTETDGASDALYAADLALQLEKFVYLKIDELYKVADTANDHAMTDFLDGYLSHQVDAIKEAADLVAQIKRVGTGHGIYHIDRVLLEA